MDSKDAYKIITSSSEITDDWKIIIHDKNIEIISFNLSFSKYISFEKYVKKYSNFNITKYMNLVGEYYFSSIGFISQEDYFLAEDILSKDKIKNKDLKYGYKYLGIDGKKYTYIDNINIKSINIDFENLFLTKEIEKERFKFFSKYSLFDTKFININSKKVSEELSFDDNIKKIEKKMFDRIKSNYYNSHLYNLFIYSKDRIFSKEYDFFRKIDSEWYLEKSFLNEYDYNIIHEEKDNCSCNDRYYIKFNKFRLYLKLLRFIKSDELVCSFEECLTNEVFKVSGSDDYIPF